MQQFAIFVDAGYLCMAGGTLVAQKPTTRRQVQLHIPEMLAALIKEGAELANNKPLLRVYWYDGCPGGQRKSAEHSVIANQSDVKIRLGTINQEGRQKGVDTMLVLDLVELAQNRAISDAIIVGGDEDLRMGMLRAQALGVRVHLLGIDSLDDYNQSSDMIDDADRVTKWNRDQLLPLISVAPDTTAPAQPTVARTEPDTIDPNIEKAAQEAASRANLRDISLYWSAFNNRGLPGDIDGRLLASARGMIGRDLTGEEKRTLRAIHSEALKERIRTEMVDEEVRALEQKPASTEPA